MKKQYIIPLTNIVRINPVHVIAASILTTSGADGLSVGTETSGDMDVDARSDNSWNNIWDN